MGDLNNITFYTFFRQKDKLRASFPFFILFSWCLGKVSLKYSLSMQELCGFTCFPLLP